MQRKKKIWDKAESYISELLFPEKCICTICGEERFINDNGLCDVCMKTVNTTVFEGNTDATHYVDGVFTVFIYKDVSQAITGLKFHSKAYLAKRLVVFMMDLSDECSIDMVTNVPIAFRKRLLRGYNQSELLAREYARRFNIPFRKDILGRGTFKKGQIGLSRSERISNQKNSMKIREGCDLTGKNILIVDDVITTGSTINECARVLKENGAQKVYAYSVSHG